MPTLFRTGLKRKYPLMVHFGQLEDEWVARKSYSLKVSKAEFVRSLVLPGDYREELVRLREEQKRELKLPKRKASSLPNNYDL